MSSLVRAGVPVAIEAAWGVSGLPAALSVYDVTGATVLVSGPAAMTETLDGSYVGKFTPQADKLYHAIKAVYTDGTFATLSPNYNPGSETLQSIALSLVPSSAGIQLFLANKSLPIVVYEPGSLVIDFFATDPLNANVPIDLTTVTEIAVSILSSTPNVCITKLLSTGGVVIIGDPRMGHFQARFTSADVAAMARSTADASGIIDPTTLQSITVKITDPTNPSRNPLVTTILNAVAVLAPAC
jgi:hypothetical protein